MASSLLAPKCGASPPLRAAYRVEITCGPRVRGRLAIGDAVLAAHEAPRELGTADPATDLSLDFASPSTGAR